MSVECEFCEAKFSNKSALNYHKKTAKYCLKLRGESSTFTCDVCKKELSDKRQFEKHTENCSQSQSLKNLEKLNIEKDITITLLKEQIKQYEKTIVELQNKLENVAIQGVKKPSSTTNNILRIENLTDEWLKESSHNLTLEHIQRGSKGYAEFASRHSLRDRVKCVDFARQILQYKEDDAVIRDKKGRKLSKKFFQSIESKNKHLILEAMRSIREEMEDKTEEEMDVLIDKMNKFVDMKTVDLVNNQDLKEEFVRELCELL